MAKLIWGSASSWSVTCSVGRQGLRTTYHEERYQNMSASGKVEQINIYGIQQMECDLYFSEDQYRDMVAWWSWVRQGKSFSFALNNASTAATTLASAASASQASIVVNSASGIIQNNELLLRNASSDDQFEIIKVSTTSGSTITATENLKYTYPAGSTFRHMNYWDNVLIMDTDFNPTRPHHNANYRMNMKFIENL